ADGKARRLTDEFPAEEGLAWSPDGSKIWFAAIDLKTSHDQRSVFNVTLSGKIQQAFQIPADATVADVSKDGRVLFSREVRSNSVMAAFPSSAPARNFSSSGSGVDGVLSDDGKLLVYTEVGP